MRHVQQVVADYQRFPGRSPTPAQLHDGLAFLNGGGSRETFDALLVSSPEYLARHGRSAPPVVQAVYHDLLGRAATSSELARGVKNVSAASIRALALQLLAGNEARTRLITGWYLNDLRRRPTALELRDSLVALRGGVSVDQVEASILSSAGFLARA